MMTSNSLLDPGLALDKITLRFLQLFLAFCVAILTGMTYLAYQGKSVIGAFNSTSPFGNNDLSQALYFGLP